MRAPCPSPLLQPARPKLQLELPYRLYRLTRADGAPAERADKHPFCMSRVYYDASEKPEEVRGSRSIQPARAANCPPPPAPSCVACLPLFCG